MNFIIYDSIDNDGIDIEFDFKNGMAIKLFLDDNSAQEMIDMIQNKLNAREG